MQVLVRVPAIRSVLRPVFSIVSTHLGLAQALICPVRGFSRSCTSTRVSSPGCVIAPIMFDR